MGAKTLCAQLRRRELGARGSLKARLGDSCTAWTLEGAPVSAGCLCGWGRSVWKLGAPTRQGAGCWGISKGRGEDGPPGAEAGISP